MLFGTCHYICYEVAIREYLSMSCTAMGNERLSLCRCQLSQVIQRQTLIKTQFSQHKSVLCEKCRAFCLIVLFISWTYSSLICIQSSAFLPPSLSLSVALSSSMTRNHRHFTCPLTRGWYFSAQAYAKLTFYCEQLLPCTLPGLEKMI